MSEVNINLKLIRDRKTGRSAQEEFINCTKRHTCFSGGYGNGKSFAASIKALILLTSFPKYRIAICRYSATDLKRSTMSTFFKICPPELYNPQKGGNRADSLNYLKLTNGSEVFWMHLDDADEQTVRGLEVNSVIVDQAEEISENIWDHLRARIGRWDVVEVPEEYIKQNPLWPRNQETGRPLAPAYTMILCNPDSELHWIYRRYHPDSLEWMEKYHFDHEMIQASSTENPSLDQDTLRDMMTNDPVWVRRFVFGEWGIPGGNIHTVSEDSILEVGKDIDVKFVENLRRSASLYRILDHGDASPTCCMWIAAYKNWFFCYREYYQPGKIISEHRANIDQLSRYQDGSIENYKNNWADPALFKKNQQKFGGFWCTADEYSDPRIEGPQIFFQPADNNEFATRNRLNEYLKLSDDITSPSITATSPAPRLYFIKKSDNYPNGCYHSILETKSQKRKQLGTLNGKPIFSDERDESIADHSYDPVRYFIAMHPFWTSKKQSIVSKGSFLDVRKQAKLLREAKRQEVVELGAY